MNNFLKELIFIPKCKSCHKIADKDNLCNDCREKLNKCKVENPSVSLKNSIKECDGAFGSYLYKNTAEEVLKFAKFRNPARFLNSFTADVSVDILKIIEDNNIDVVIPAPSHKSKLYIQTFSLPEEMVKRLAKVGIKTDLKCIVKMRKTEKQHNLSLEKRKVNLLNAFKVVGNAENKNILIIDDVITTGNTISELATELKTAGRGKVYAWRYTINLK